MAFVEVRDLVKHFPIRGGVLDRVLHWVQAVNGVSFDIERGEVLGVVGESGCGKSTLGKVLNRLIPATSGSIKYEGHELTKLKHAEMIPFRRKMQFIFQDPYSSLNPRQTVRSLLAEGIRFHGIVPPGDTDEYIVDLLGKVGLRADDRLKFPHEFSGGQRQRIGVARALSVKPEFIIADEPVSALDVSIQAQILNLLMDLQEEYSLTILFISHDLKVIEHFCDRVLVMYLGRIMEGMRCADLHAQAAHPYTRALLGANPINDPKERRPLTVLEGDVPNPSNPPPGCPFQTRCPDVMEPCRQDVPILEVVAEQQEVACWAVDKPAA